MTQAADPDRGLAGKYDAAALRWGDKVRLLGYYDACLGLLSSLNFRAPGGNRVLDIGCGTGAFAEAWIAIQGPHQSMTLLDPSLDMLERATAALARRDVAAETVLLRLKDYAPDRTFDCLLAAHVLEHTHDPQTTLRQARALVEPVGHL